jgi:acetyl-CoA carboxylase biotin carboxyl carrier protein
MNQKEIEKIIELIQGTDIEEIEYSRGSDTLKIRRHLTRLPARGPEPRPEVSAAGEAVGTPDAGDAGREGLFTVRSPLVGTFYRSPSPDAKPFVEVDDTVTKGQVICIVEAMKLLNEIEAECAGRVVAVLVDNGRPVEFGEPLFEIEPLG